MKKKGRETGEAYDRISSLQDDLLCHILSLLPTKHAVATTVISTRWKNLFALVSDLNFDDSLTRSKTSDVVPFCFFVSNVICALLTKSTYIRKFHLVCDQGTYQSSIIATWICAASLLNLQDLFVSAKSLTSPLKLPSQLFHCTTLKDMRLNGKFSLSVPNHVFFPSLKTLELSDLSLMDNESVRRFFFGCIVLEKLCLFECVVDTISVLAVSIASLKHLDLSEMNGDYAFLLDAPRLEYFYCSSYATRGYYGNMINSLVTVNINIDLEDEHFADEKVSQLVNMVSNAKSLSLSSDSLEPLLDHSVSFPNLTELLVEANNTGGWFSLPNLLDNAPCLEVLYFDEGVRDQYGNFIDAAACLPERVPVCVSDHLKKVNLFEFHGEEDEFKLVEYFLKNCKVLETMTITPYVDFFSDDSTSNTKQSIPMTKRLLNLPRSSRACRIVFTDVDNL